MANDIPLDNSKLFNIAHIYFSPIWFVHSTCGVKIQSFERHSKEIVNKMMINSTFNASSLFCCTFMLQLIGKGINEEDSLSVIVGLRDCRLSWRCGRLPSVNDSRIFPISVILTWRGGNRKSFRTLNLLRSWNCKLYETLSLFLLGSFTNTGPSVFPET